MRRFLLPLLLAAVSAPAADAPRVPDLAQLQKMTARFAPTELRASTEHLSAGDRRALAKLIEAAKVVDDVFLKQLYAKNPGLLAELRKDTTPLGKARLRYFWMNKGPWSSIDDYAAFLPGVPARKPLGANYYPEGFTKEQFESWKAKLPEPQKKKAEGFFWVVRLGKQRDLRLVPYSQEYRAELTRMSALLKEAAAATDNATLKRFLVTRAQAFLADDYYESDVAWMDLDAPIDVTIGPYETYSDELLGYKAAFEAYVCLRDDAETKKLAFLTSRMQELEDNLPLDPKYRNPKVGALAPLRVVNEVYSGGEGNQGVQSAAFNLPNDERVVREKGSKRVMLKNVQRAKFEKTLVPIAERVIGKEAARDLSFDSFFTHIVAHEVTHGLGPHAITVGGVESSPRKELKELYGALEEAKADVTGLVALQYLMDKGAPELPGGAEAERRLYTTFLASSFRTLRFGIHEAHARGMAMQVNALVDKGGFVVRPDGTYGVDFAKIKDAVRELDRELLTLEATGDYAGAKKKLEELGKLRPELEKALAGLGDVPIDIEPVFGK